MIEKKLDYEKYKEEYKKEASQTKTKSTSNKLVKKNRFASFFKKFPAGISSVLTNKNLMTKIGITLLIVFIYRLLASVPLPGVDMGVYESYFRQASASEASYFFLIFTGSTLETPSIVGLGIAAYIQASIVMQLLTPAIPKLTELSKEGARGQQLINQYTRYLTLPLSFIYSLVYLVILSQTDLSGTGAGDFLISPAEGGQWPSIEKLIFMAIILTAGSLFLMWLAEVITENGLGNGSSVIISIGILSSLPSLLSQDFGQLDLRNIITEVFNGNLGVLTQSLFLALIAVIIGFLAMIVIIVYANEAMRKIRIQYARRAVASSPNADDSHLPIKLTISGVLPIIFASALLSFPQLILPLLQRASSNESLSNFIASLENSFLFSTTDGVVDKNDAIYAVVYFVLIILFGVFYSFIAMKPADTAENLQKNSAFIPGVRPGKSTENFISKVLLRIGFAGSIFLALIALVPLIARNYIELSSGLNLFVLTGIGGTSILIVVSVVLDTYRQFNSQRLTKSYSQYATAG